MRQLTTWLSMFVLAAVDAWGAPPEQQPPGDVRQISVGEEVNGVLLNLGDEEFFELTAPRDGILVVRLSAEIQPHSSPGLMVEDRYWEPRVFSRMSVKLPVAAGSMYRIKVYDTSFDYGGLSMPFVLTTAMEPRPPLGCSYNISLTGDFEELADSIQFDLTSSRGSFGVWLLAPAGCPWTAENSAPFVAIYRRVSDGTDAVFLDVAPNFTASARTATVRIAGQPVTVTQGRGVPLVDFDREGHFDLLWHNRTTGLLSAWLMTGTKLSEGVRLSPQQVPDTNWEPVGSGDLNGDGHADLVWQNKSDGRISAWLMAGLQKVYADLLSIPQVTDLNWRVRAVTDTDGDGRADILWQHLILSQAWRPTQT